MVRSFSLLFVVCLLLPGAVHVAPADDAPLPDDATWSELVTRKDEALQRLGELRQVLQSPTERPSREEAEVMIEEYNSLVADLQDSL